MDPIYYRPDGSYDPYPAAVPQKNPPYRIEEFEFKGTPFLRVEFHVIETQLSLEFFHPDSDEPISWHAFNLGPYPTEDSVSYQIKSKMQEIKSVFTFLGNRGIHPKTAVEDGTFTKAFPHRNSLEENISKFMAPPTKEFPIEQKNFKMGQSVILGKVIVKDTEMYAEFYNYSTDSTWVFLKEPICRLENPFEDIESQLTKYFKSLEPHLDKWNDVETFVNLRKEYWVEKKSIEEQRKHEAELINSYGNALTAHKKIVYCLEKSLLGEIADIRQENCWKPIFSDDFQEDAVCSSITLTCHDIGELRPWSSARNGSNGLEIVDIDVSWITSFTQFLVLDKYNRQERPAQHEIIPAFIKMRERRAATIKYIMNEPAISEYKLYEHGELVAIKHANRFEVVNQRLFTKCLEVPTKEEIMREFHQLKITPEFIQEAKDREIIPHNMIEKLALWQNMSLSDALYKCPGNGNQSHAQAIFEKEIEDLNKEQSRLYCEIKLLIDDAIQKRKGIRGTRLYLQNYDRSVCLTYEYLKGERSLHTLNVTLENTRKYLEITKLFGLYIALINCEQTEKFTLARSDKDLRALIIRTDPNLSSTETYLKTLYQERITEEEKPCVEYRADSKNWNPDRVGIQMQVVANTYVKVRETSKGLDSIIAGRGNSGAGKSTWFESLGITDGMINPDTLKADLRRILPVLNSQIHEEGKRLYENFILSIATHSRLNYALDTRLLSVKHVEEKVIEPAKLRGVGIFICDFDVSLLTSLNRILTRPSGGKDPVPKLEAILEGIIELRSKRQAVLDRIIDDDVVTDYELRYNGRVIAKKTENGFKIDPSSQKEYEECLHVPTSSEIKIQLETIITQEYIQEAIASNDIRKDQKGCLKTWIGFTIGDAITKHALGKKPAAVKQTIQQEVSKTKVFVRPFVDEYDTVYLYVEILLKDGKLIAEYYSKKDGNILFQEVISEEITGSQNLEEIVDKHIDGVFETLKSLKIPLNQLNLHVENGTFKQARADLGREMDKIENRRIFEEKLIGGRPSKSPIFVYNATYSDSNDPSDHVFLYLRMVVRDDVVSACYSIEKYGEPFFEEIICKLDNVNQNHLTIYEQHLKDMAETFNYLARAYPGKPVNRFIEEGEFIEARQNRERLKLNTASFPPEKIKRVTWTCSFTHLDSRGRAILFVEINLQNDLLKVNYFDKQDGTLLFEENIMTTLEFFDFFRKKKQAVVILRDDIELMYSDIQKELNLTLRMIDTSKESLKNAVKNGKFAMAMLCRSVAKAIKDRYDL